MPGKQDPEYFPLDLNTMNGGLGFYGEVNPILIPHRHHGKFDRSVVHHGSPIAMALHNSPVNATMSDYINNMNGLPLVTSEDEEEEDDIVSQSGSESVSVQGSDLDLDVETMDDVDSLVLNIRDKLRMAGPQFNIHSSHSSGEYWTDSPSATSTPNSIHSTASNIETDLLILPQQRSSSTANSSNNKSSSSSHQRKRRGPLNSRSSGTHWRNSNPSGNHSFYRQFHANQSGSITKSKKTSSFHQSHWWSSRSFSDLSKQSRSKEAYHLLQELIQSGTLIKEAVRRLNRNCLNSPNGSTINSNQETITPSNSTASLVVSSTAFSYMDEDSENTFSTSHHHSSLQLSAPCN